MNWKDVLYFDLGRLLGKKPSADTEASSRNRPVLFRRIRSLFRSKRAPGRHYADPSYKPCTYYQRRQKKKWRGPFYVRSSQWRRDLLHVVTQLTAIAKANGSLAKGVEACAREQRRLHTGLRAKNVFSMLTALLGVGIVLVPAYILGAPLLDRPDLYSYVYFIGMGVLSLIPAWILLHRAGRVEAVLLRLRDELAAGHPLSEAMGGLPAFFPRFFVDMTKAGEDSGKLAECLGHLGDDTLRACHLRKVLAPNMAYLGLVLLVQCLLTLFIALRVYPVMQEICAEFGAPMHKGILEAVAQGITSLTGYYSRGHGFITTPNPRYVLPLAAVALVVACAFVVSRLWRRRAFSTRGLAVGMLMIPGLRGLLIHQNTATIALLLEKLLRAGMPLDAALNSIADMEINPVFARAVRQARDRVRQGDAPAEAWRRAAQQAPLPSSFLAFMDLGEHSGMLPDACARLAQWHQALADKRLRIMTDMLTPVGILCLGALTFVVQLEFFQTMVLIYQRFLESM